MIKAAITVLGIDLGKNSCSAAGLDASGAIVFRRRATREGVLKLIASLPPCIVAMEALLRRTLHGACGSCARS